MWGHFLLKIRMHLNLKQAVEKVIFSQTRLWANKRKYYP